MPPDGERVTTGSEPKRAWPLRLWICDKGHVDTGTLHGVCWACFPGGRRTWEPGEPRQTEPNQRHVDVVPVEVVESGHDEQTEDARAEFERVVDFLNEQGVTLWGDDDPIYHGGHSMEALADAFEERFKPSAPGGDDGH